uniref:Lipase n=1 Tax=Acrobeloides nanus TaxID=290746 RepID=A0A914CED5_9BILA
MKTALLLASFIVFVFAQQGPITQDFQNWLSTNGYSSDDFVRADLGSAGSYGGRNAPTDKVVKNPVIFIHGNSDAALYYNSESTGWTNSVKYFLGKGYTTQELYATTWGDADPLNAGTRVHDCATLGRLRRWVEAIMKYTNATKIAVITHSMGVTLGRKIIQGGSVTGDNCNLGPSLIPNVDTYVGLAGGNYGLCSCEGGDAFISATCNQKNGFWPGDSCGLNTLTCGEVPLTFPCDPTSVTYSSFLSVLNSNNAKEAAYLFSAWSIADNLILYEDQVWGRPTSLIRNSTGYKQYLTYTHMETKELTAADQYNMVVYHTVS